MLLRDITKIVITGGLIGIMLFIEMEKLKISRRPYWNYVIQRFDKLEFLGGYIGIMLFIDITKENFSAAILELCYL